jgi:hypothetical protein
VLKLWNFRGNQVVHGNAGSIRGKICEFACAKRICNPKRNKEMVRKARCAGQTTRYATTLSDYELIATNQKTVITIVTFDIPLR